MGYVSKKVHMDNSPECFIPEIHGESEEHILSMFSKTVHPSEII